MKVANSEIDGLTCLFGDAQSDQRGTFYRVAELGFVEGGGFGQADTYLAVAHNVQSGTVRGLHYQVEPHAENKLVWCTRGRLYDVVVDIRPASSTFGRWAAFELSWDHPTALFIPRGLAHGYQTLEDDTSVSYMIAGEYVRSAARTIRWSDPTLAITWPLPVAEISERDERAPLWGSELS